MKLSKLNKIISYMPLLLMVYSLFCLVTLKSKWYINNWAVLDRYDTIIYIISYVHFAFFYKTYSYYAKVFLVCISLYLGFKLLDNYILFRYSGFIFWNIYILVFLPLVFWFDKNLNK